MKLEQINKWIDEAKALLEKEDNGLSVYEIHMLRLSLIQISFLDLISDEIGDLDGRGY